MGHAAAAMDGVSYVFLGVGLIVVGMTDVPEGEGADGERKVREPGEAVVGLLVCEL